MSKKLMALVLAMLVMVAFAACGDDEPAPATSSKAASSGGAGGSSSAGLTFDLPAYLTLEVATNAGAAEATDGATAAVTNKAVNAPWSFTETLITALNAQDLGSFSGDTTYTKDAYQFEYAPIGADNLFDTNSAATGIQFKMRAAGSAANLTATMGLTGVGTAATNFVGGTWIVGDSDIATKSLAFWFRGKVVGTSLRFEVGGGGSTANYFEIDHNTALNSSTNTVVAKDPATGQINAKLIASGSYDHSGFEIPGWTKVKVKLNNFAANTGWTLATSGLRFRTRFVNGAQTQQIWMIDLISIEDNDP